MTMDRAHDDLMDRTLNILDEHFPDLARQRQQQEAQIREATIDLRDACCDGIAELTYAIRFPHIIGAQVAAMRKVLERFEAAAEILDPDYEPDEVFDKPEVLPRDEPA